MSKEKNGGAAFPGFDYYRSKPLPAESQGMDLRDYFAAKAMQSFLLAPKPESPLERMDIYFQSVAEISYEMADAMLRAREAS